MNNCMPRPLSWKDLLKIREKLPGSMLEWEVTATRFCGPVRGWIMSPSIILFRLGWLKSNSEGEWEQDMPDGYTLGFNKLEVTPKILVNGDVIFTYYDSCAGEIVDFRIWIDKGWLFALHVALNAKSS